MRSKVTQLLDSHYKVKDENVTKTEWRMIGKLKKNDTIMVLPVDKDQVTVVIKKEEYL